MKTQKYRIVLNAPAFLGNSSQEGQWRSPPFKALLRQCWRMAYSHSNSHKVDVNLMRKAESQLFGSVGSGNAPATKSKLRLRLMDWSPGTLTKLPKFKQHQHPEVAGRPVSTGLYLGFGPVKNDKKEGAALTNCPALDAGAEAELRLAYSEEFEQEILLAAKYMHLIGTLGGRSRNGWGSFELLPIENVDVSTDFMPLHQHCRPWRDCLEKDWAHAIGADNNGPLVWQTTPQTSWVDVIDLLASIKIDMRTQFKFNHGNTGMPEDRHVLSYPVTRHKVKSWSRNTGRLPNSLRFKIIRTGDNQIAGKIIHVPCSPPKDFSGFGPNQIENTWQSVHQFLDTVITLNRVR